MPKQLSEILASGAVQSGAFDRDRLPIFPRSITECTTADSSPYLCSMDEFEKRYGFTIHRTNLIEQLIRFVEGSRAIGVCISAMLVGGSFVDQSNERPGDIDCLAFYSINADDQAVDGIISNWVIYRRDFLLDVKLCPTDVGLTTIIKRSIFFSNLFSLNKSSLALERGAILIELFEQRT